MSIAFWDNEPCGAAPLESGARIKHLKLGIIFAPKVRLLSITCLSCFKKKTNECAA